ncbi:conserved hypothetical protein [Leishmania mexicana MHOM/GT/2001/U1103]|uniref:SET domain-containing protein n=1 Tax=Leishmania mexicana (strain MHOM/GT/2001/U1103) TaxID=929439 RepID=E9B5H2_LEIMU|nr:conserved hypothetical protein [Leishmania mexicana MHOM/GT/2001/U1103]CBZ30492.1 conserved hypothetical protein [Leishmania mexicana MHOM/GT/2001/U1103]
MRARRSCKFAEYLSTYAILEHIGIHPTTLIEKRDAAVGVGVYVRDACDAGTTLLAVPSKRFCTTSVLSRVGLKTSFCSPWRADSEVRATASAGPACDVHGGILSFLTGTTQWPELAWRLALEQHRSVSPLWGWLQSLPSVEELADRRDAAERHCRVHHTMLLPYYFKGRQRIREETLTAYSQLRAHNILPCFDRFAWAVDVVLSRGLLLPTAWPDTGGVFTNSTAGGEQEEGGSDPPPHISFECGVVPFLDLVNAPDDIGRAVNADIEVATSFETLPKFLTDELAADATARGRGGDELAEVKRLLETHYYLCLTLRKPLRASEEVILDWQVPVLTTEVLTAAEDALVSRFLKYMF